MSGVSDLDRFLRAQLRARGGGEDAPVLPRPPRPFVTISRQAGVGGHALGDAVVDHFARHGDGDLFTGWRVYDKAICEMVAADPRYQPSLDSLIDEVYRVGPADFFHQMLRNAADQASTMRRVFLVVRTIASMGSAVIIGRAGSHVTRGLFGGISIRVVGPEALRAKRTMEALGIGERAALARNAERDAHRARLLSAEFGADIDDPLGYDAVFNIERVAAEDIAAWLAVRVRRLASESELSAASSPRSRIA